MNHCAPIVFEMINQTYIYTLIYTRIRRYGLSKGGPGEISLSLVNISSVERARKISLIDSSAVQVDTLTYVASKSKTLL